MSRLTVNINNRKSEKVILAVLNALGLSYEIDSNDLISDRKPLNKDEKKMYESLKSSIEEIKLHQAGKIKLKTIEELVAELS